MWIKAVELTRQRQWVPYLKSMTTPWPAKISRDPVRPGEPLHTAVVGPGRHARKRLLPVLGDLAGFSLELGVVRRMFSDPAVSFDLTTDFNAMLADPELQAAVVAVPSSILAQVASRCLAAGLHVYCECPAALSSGDLDVLERAAIAGSAPQCQIGYNLRALAELQSLSHLTRAPHGSWRLEISFHSLYHLCDLISFLAGPIPAISVRAAGQTFEILFQNDRHVFSQLSPGPLKIQFDPRTGPPVTVEIETPDAVVGYQRMFQNFESAVRGQGSLICPLADLRAGFSLYAAVRRARFLSRFG